MSGNRDEAVVVRPSLAAGDWIRLSAERQPRHPCFVLEDGSSRSFQQVNREVNQLAAALAAGGVRTGDRVAILAVDSVEYVETLFATMKLGATYVPLNYRLVTSEVHTLLARAAPKYLFVSDRYAGVGRDAAAGVTSLQRIVAYDGPGRPAADETFAGFIDGFTSDEPDVSVDDDDILGLAFTSGTTGLPKGVLQSQHMLKTMVTNMALDYELRLDEFRYTASPIFHIAGQGMLFMHAMRGFTSLVLPQFRAPTVLSWMQRGLTGCFLVPTMISALLDLPEAEGHDYGALQSIIYGASPMPPTLLRRAMDTFGCDFIQAFGASTEGGLQAVLTSADHRRAYTGDAHLLGSIGRPSNGVLLQLHDESGKQVERGQVGEIVTRSDPVMHGYLEMPEQTREALRDGWFHGGDLAYQDDEGYLYLAGRAKDMIIRGGENVYPVEIETVLSELTEVVDSSVIGRPDPHWGEVVVAYLTVRDPEAVDVQRIRAHCARRLAGYKLPVAYRVVPELPRNASGKVLKRDLRVAEEAMPVPLADAVLRDEGAPRSAGAMR